jgi:hypothetical protein
VYAPLDARVAPVGERERQATKLSELAALNGPPGNGWPAGAECSELLEHAQARRGEGRGARR